MPGEDRRTEGVLGIKAKSLDGSAPFEGLPYRDGETLDTPNLSAIASRTVSNWSNRVLVCLSMLWVTACLSAVAPTPPDDDGICQ